MPEPFTPDSLHDVLGRVLSRRQHMPAEAEIERLAGLLNHWQAHYAGQADADDDKLLQQEETALETLAVVLPKLKAKTRAELAFLHAVKCSGNITIAKEQRLGQITVLLQSVMIAMQSRFWTKFWNEHNAVDQKKKWHELQDALAQDFIAAMKPANPHETFGLSERGVLARYISSVLPAVCGETIKPSSVGAHRKKAARNRENARSINSPS